MADFCEFVWGTAEVSRDIEISLQSATSFSPSVALETIRALVLARPDVPMGKRKLFIKIFYNIASLTSLN